MSLFFLTTITLFCLSGAIWPKARFLIFLSSRTLSLGLMVCMLGLGLIMALVPQSPTPLFLMALPGPADFLGLTRLSSHWLFRLIYISVLINLGLAVTRRWRSLAFMSTFNLNHLGLWLLLIALGLSALDHHELKVELEPGQSENFGQTDWGLMTKLPFDLSLSSLEVDEYPPKLLLMNLQGQIEGKNSTQLEIVPEKLPNFGHLQDWDIAVERYLPLATPSGNEYIPLSGQQGYPAAYVTASRKNETIKGWVANSDNEGLFKILPLADTHLLVLIRGEALRLVSEITVKTPLGKKISAQIEANHPLSLGAWRIYQSGYLKNSGHNSSVLLLVYNPWRYLVWGALALLTAGAFRILWKAK